jgi:hypothetical protein
MSRRGVRKMKFIKTPYLPESDIALSVSSREAFGRTVAPFTGANLPKGLKSHADLTICYLGDGVCVTAPESYEYYKSALSETGIEIVRGEKYLDRHYPDDCAYNVAIVGKKLFCKTSVTDKNLLGAAEKTGCKIININQGYAKCSVCPVTENAAISGDVSFAKAAEKEGIDVYIVSNDKIVLPGYKNGFFGGAAYMKNKNTLVTAGSLDFTDEKRNVEEFLKKYGVRLEADENAPVFDFGSLVALMCE